MKIGYARVSSTGQHLDIQVAALTDAGCEKIYEEKVSGVAHREQLQECMQYLREGDCLVIYKLDRLGRSLKDLLDIIEQLQKRNISLVSLKDNIDTGSTTGKLVLHIFASLAEFERDLIKERTDEGRREAKKKGVRFGRPKQPKPSRSRNEHRCVPSFIAMVTVCRPSCGLPTFGPGTQYINTSAWKELSLKQNINNKTNRKQENRYEQRI